MAWVSLNKFVQRNPDTEFSVDQIRRIYRKARGTPMAAAFTRTPPGAPLRQQRILINEELFFSALADDSRTGRVA